MVRLAWDERHALGPPGAAAGVQDERDVVQRRRLGPAAERLAAEGQRAGGVQIHGQDRHVAGGLARLVEAVGRQQQDLGAGVLEEEAELLLLVAGVEGGGGAGLGGGRGRRRWSAARWAAPSRRDRRGGCRRRRARRQTRSPSRGAGRRRRADSDPGRAMAVRLAAAGASRPSRVVGVGCAAVITLQYGSPPPDRSTAIRPRRRAGVTRGACRGRPAAAPPASARSRRPAARPAPAAAGRRCARGRRRAAAPPSPGSTAR